MDYTEFKEEVDHDIDEAMKILWHEIQSEEGAEAWLKVKEYINQLNQIL